MRVSLLSNLMPSARMLVAIDVILILWTAAWVTMGVRVSQEVEGLTRLSDTVVAVGQAVDSSGQARRAGGRAGA
jgi:hypothetical protein